MSIVTDLLQTIFSLPANLFNYITKSVFGELRKVEWLSAGEVAQFTFAVVALTIITGLIIVGFDIMFVTIRNPIFTINL